MHVGGFSVKKQVRQKEEMFIESNFNDTFRKQNLDNYLVLILLVSVCEIMLLVSYVIGGTMVEPTLIYFVKNIIRPCLLNLFFLWLGRRIHRSKVISERGKNFAVSCILLLLCSVVAVIHCYYEMLFFTPCYAIFISTHFRDRIIVRRIWLLSHISLGCGLWYRQYLYDIPLSQLVETAIIMVILYLTSYVTSIVLFRNEERKMKYITQMIRKRNELLEEMLLDPLTGLFHKGALVREMENAIIGDRICWLVMIDLDNFKKVNDTFGHVVGDNVIVTLAGYLKEIVANKGGAYRFGGEEFVLVIYDLSKENLISLLDETRKTFYAGEIPGMGKVRISFSAGVAKLQVGDTKEQWMKKADSALYQGKKRGRNTIVLYEDRLPCINIQKK